MTARRMRNFCTAGLVALASYRTLPDALAQAPIESLFEAHGPATSDTVVIFAQGGPFPNLRPDLIDSLPGMDRRLRVSVHQPWTLDERLLDNPDAVSSDDVVNLTVEAVEALDRVVRHFLDKGSSICVVGHSYGALLTLSWLATYDRPVAIQVLAGRLAFPEIVWSNFRAGRLYWFPDGSTPEPVGNEAPIERLVAMRLQAEVGAKRYTDLLEGRDLSNLTFVYGDRDRLVGSLTEQEVDFLNLHGARVIRIAGGDHRDMFGNTHAALVTPAFTCGVG